MTVDLEPFAFPRKQIQQIRLAEVRRRTGMTTSTIYRWIGQRKFPRSYRIGEHLVAWSEAEIEEWTASKAGLVGCAEERH